MRRSLAVLLVALPALAAGACEDPVRPAELLSGSIVTSDTTLFVGDTATIEAIVERRSGTEAPDSLVWSVSNTKAVRLVPRADGRATLEAVSRGTAYVVARIEGTFVDSSEVQVVREGDVRWRVRLPGQALFAAGGPALDGLGRVYASQIGPTLISVLTAGGDPVYSVPSCTGRLSPSVRGIGQVYASNPVCTARHGPLGSVEWSVSMGNFDGGVAVGADGSALILDYVDQDTGYAAALTRIFVTGDEAWRAVLGPTTGDPPQTSAPVIAADGTIYVVWNESFPGPNWLSRVAPDGSIEWTVPAYGRMYGASPALVDGRVITTGRFAGLAVYDTTGTRLWAQTWSGTGSGVSSPAVDGEGNIYVQSRTYLRSYDGDGNLRWAVSELDCLTCGFGIGGPTLVSDGRILVQCEDPTGGDTRELCAVNGSDGTLSWRSSTGGGVYGTPAVSPGGMIYVTLGGTGELASLWGRTPPLMEGWPTEGGSMRRLRREER